MLVALPSVEQGRHVQAAAVVGVLGHVLSKVPLKVDLFVAVLQPLLPESVFGYFIFKMSIIFSLGVVLK